jgi:hypothetical protein
VVNLRQVFLQASGQLYNILTLGRFDDGLLGALVPDRRARARGCRRRRVRCCRGRSSAPIARRIAGSAGARRASPVSCEPDAVRSVRWSCATWASLFASQGLTVLGTWWCSRLTLGAGIGSAIGSPLRRPPRGLSAESIGGLLRLAAGGLLPTPAGRVIGGAVGIAIGGVARGRAERALTTGGAADRYAALPQTQRHRPGATCAGPAAASSLALPYAAGSVYAATWCSSRCTC